MHPVLRAAVACAALAAVAALGHRSARARTVFVRQSILGTSSDDLSSVCPAGMLPDYDHCVTIPETVEGDEGASLTAVTNVHHEKSGRVATYEQIPRLPERPVNYDVFRFPVPPPASGHFSVSGYDLDKPDSDQRRGSGLTFVGHGGVDLMQARGVEVRSVSLEHQQGETTVVYAAPLFGISVVTKHTVRESGRLRDYIVLHGHLDGIAQGIVPGTVVQEGDLLGYVGDTGSEGIVHLHLEVRQVRDGVQESELRTQNVVRNVVSIPCDPRNVFPLREVSP